MRRGKAERQEVRRGKAVGIIRARVVWQDLQNVFFQDKLGMSCGLEHPVINEHPVVKEHPVVILQQRSA